MIYKIGYYLTKFTYELSLYEILIIIKKFDNIIFIFKWCKMYCFIFHLKLYNFDKDKSEILKTVIYWRFNEPSININKILNGILITWLVYLYKWLKTHIVKRNF